MIKLFRIDKIIWFSLVLLLVLFESIITLIFSILRFIFNFKIGFNDIWRSFHRADYDFQNYWGGYSYVDNNPIDTLIRRYTKTF